jgi:cysteine-S-conjugate beta-lyase
MTFEFDRIIDQRNAWSLKWDFGERILGQRDIIPMWVADMDFPTPPAVVEAIRKRAEHGIYGYPITSKSFWPAVLRWLETRLSWPVEKGWLLRAPGVVSSLCLCVRAFSNPGDGVIVQTPVYFPFFGAVETNGRRLVRNPLKYESGRFLMDFENLERQIDSRTRMLILCSPHNPVGRVWTKDELERLGRICAANEIVIVSDEIHAELVFGGRRHIPTASLSEDLASRTITLFAPSKTFNLAGLTTSLAVVPNPGLRKRLSAEFERSGFELSNLFGLVALEAAYAHGGEWLDAVLLYLEGNLRFLQEFVAARIPRLKFLAPEGTYLGLLDCRSLGLEQKALHEFFWKRAKVYFSDGLLFGEELRGFMRINFACPRPLLSEALQRIEKAVGELAAA